jgi:hypothetical protein
MKIICRRNERNECLFPDSVTGNVDQQVPVLITDFKVYNTSVNTRKTFYGKQLLQTSILSTHQISLPYKIKGISFEFVALNHEPPNSMIYAYKLDGFDEQWNDVSPDRRSRRRTEKMEMMT